MRDGRRSGRRIDCAGAWYDLALDEFWPDAAGLDEPTLNPSGYEQPGHDQPGYHQPDD